jgi:transcriptional regulator with XRE-family HTH domain
MAKALGTVYHNGLIIKPTARDRKRLTQNIQQAVGPMDARVLAGKMGRSIVTVTRFMKGLGLPAPATIPQIAKATGKPLDQIVAGTCFTELFKASSTSQSNSDTEKPWPPNMGDGSILDRAQQPAISGTPEVSTQQKLPLSPQEEIFLTLEVGVDDALEDHKRRVAEFESKDCAETKTRVDILISQAREKLTAQQEAEEAFRGAENAERDNFFKQLEEGFRKYKEAAQKIVS